MAGTFDFEAAAKVFWGKGAKVELKNANLALLESDYLYHIGFNSKQDLKEMFGDVKFVITGGSGKRMCKFAHRIAKEINYSIPTGTGLIDLSASTDRYSMYKTGPVLFVNHGMGMPSISIMLHEVVKLLHYAGATDVCMIRMGTSGGLGVEPGSIVLSNNAVNAMFKPYHRAVVLGKDVMNESHLSADINNMIAACWDEEEVQIVHGNTMTTDDFYEGQARLDGAICEYTPEDKMAYLRAAHAAGVINIEMESLVFAAFTHRMGIPAAMCAVTLLNRLNGDQISDNAETMAEYSDRPQRILAKFIKRVVDMKLF